MTNLDNTEKRKSELAAWIRNVHFTDEQKAKKIFEDEVARTKNLKIIFRTYMLFLVFLLVLTFVMSGMGVRNLKAQIKAEHDKGIFMCKVLYLKDSIIINNQRKVIEIYNNKYDNK